MSFPRTINGDFFFFFRSLQLLLVRNDSCKEMDQHKSHLCTSLSYSFNADFLPNGLMLVPLTIENPMKTGNPSFPPAWYSHKAWCINLWNFPKSYEVDIFVISFYRQLPRSYSC